MTTMTPTATPTAPDRIASGRSGLTDEMLARFAERAPIYDQEGRFFSEDFDELRASGYLRLPVPREFGGPGLTLAEVAREQRRLGYYAAPTALAVNMHLYWTGVAADLWHAGDRSLAWMLEAAADGEIFAAGHAESGNDLPLLLSTTKAERVEGGYRFTGRKHFGSLTPVWTMLGIHGLDASDPVHPRVVHGFLPRDAAGYRIEATWDVLGMRATRSDDTVLEGAVVPDRYIVRVVPAGARGVDRFILAVFAWGLLGFGNIYYGLARRAFDLAVASVGRKRSIAISRSMAHHPGVQRTVAEMALELEAIEPHLEQIARDWSAGVDHGALWPAKIMAAKYHAVESSWKVVDLALELGGGFAVYRQAGLERIFRDARLGRMHPGNSMLTHELVAKTFLGIDPDAQPRWG